MNVNIFSVSLENSLIEQESERPEQAYRILLPAPGEPGGPAIPEFERPEDNIAAVEGSTQGENLAKTEFCSTPENGVYPIVFKYNRVRVYCINIVLGSAHFSAPENLATKLFFLFTAENLHYYILIYIIY